MMKVVIILEFQSTMHRDMSFIAGRSITERLATAGRSSESAGMGKKTKEDSQVVSSSAGTVDQARYNRLPNFGPHAYAPRHAIFACLRRALLWNVCQHSKVHSYE